MPGPVGSHHAVAPRARVRSDGPPGDGYFYPRETLEILGMPDLNYSQLRAVFRLVRVQAGFAPPPGRVEVGSGGRGEWARFSLLDIAGARVALQLASAPAHSGRPTRRLQLKPVWDACLALRAAGFDNPLLDVPLERSGRRVLAFIDGGLIDPLTKQQALDIARSRTSGFLEDRNLEDAELSHRLECEAVRAGASMTVHTNDESPNS